MLNIVVITWLTIIMPWSAKLFIIIPGVCMHITLYRLRSCSVVINMNGRNIRVMTYTSDTDIYLIKSPPKFDICKAAEGMAKEIGSHIG